jgi:hypothetical protein
VNDECGDDERGVDSCSVDVDVDVDVDSDCFNARCLMTFSYVHFDGGFVSRDSIAGF